MDKILRLLLALFALTLTRHSAAGAGSAQTQGAAAVQAAPAAAEIPRIKFKKYTLATLFDIYRREVTPLKRASKQQHDPGRDVTAHCLGAHRQAPTLNAVTGIATSSGGGTRGTDGRGGLTIAPCGIVRLRTISSSCRPC